MIRVLFAILCCASCAIGAHSSNPVATLTLGLQPQANWEEFTSSHQVVKENTKENKNKLQCVLNILKNALSEEIAKSQLKITEENTQESHSSLHSLVEEEHSKNEEELEKYGINNENDFADERALYQKVITKIASALSKPQNVTNQNNAEIPNMIPIFKPRPSLPRNEISQNVADFKAKQSPKSRDIAFVPEKIIQTNMNSIPSRPMFNIPCQRASDVLDMTNFAIPSEAVCRDIKPKVNPIVEAPKANLQSEIPAPVTLSVNCADSEDTVAMLFKPKNISLMQLYGNLLKKITITVLVPYHMSKLGGQ